MCCSLEMVLCSSAEDNQIGHWKILGLSSLHWIIWQYPSGTLHQNRYSDTLNPPKAFAKDVPKILRRFPMNRSYTFHNKSTQTLPVAAPWLKPHIPVTEGRGWNVKGFNIWVTSSVAKLLCTSGWKDPNFQYLQCCKLQGMMSPSKTNDCTADQIWAAKTAYSFWDTD